jgi:GTP-binding protein HflX
VLLSDTVGFIRDLPHQLVASFKATLEEARQADLLIHVADGSSPAALDQIASVYNVLRELGIEEKDTLLAINKIDQVDDPSRVEAIRNLYPRAVAISARTGDGLSRLAAAVSDALSQDFLDLEIRFNVSNGRLLAFLARYGEVLSRTFTGDQATVHCRISRQHLNAIREDDAVEVRPYESAPAIGGALPGDATVGEVA